ncbi:NMDA receptor-regulated protein 1a [Clavulina sp. PMI_390]|nr:NMDA receptor-regulated protein 1a [Clavulina sp. PMI_390]
MSKAGQAPAIPKNRVLPSKEATLFKTVLQLYETQQFKRALKTADQILKKAPSHGETTSMKGLILTHMNRKDEGVELVKKGVKLDITSHICWHVLGLVHRADRNYEEALKCYTQALKFDKDNLNILRDSAQMQMHLRHFDALVESRQILLKYRANLRQGWGALAVAYLLNGQGEAAKKVLELYERTVKNVPKYDPEHSEVLLLHVRILIELKQLGEALDFLNVHAKERSITDRKAIVINRAHIYTQLGRVEDARESWRHLIEMNQECHEYYQGFLATLGSDIHAKTGESHQRAIKSLREFTEQYPKALVPQRLLLNLVSGDEFSSAVEPYIRRGITRGIPSLFADLKTLYVDAEKRSTIERIAEAILAEQEATPSDPAMQEPPSTLVWTLYFLGQHYATSPSTYPKALELLRKGIAHTPTLTELHMAEARVMKRCGDVLGASATMTVAWRLDLQDRFLNTKNAKYLLRAGFVEEANAMLGLFTRKKAVSPGADLEDMQSLLYLLEEGGAHLRAGKLHLALKRYHTVVKLFDDHEEDQYDFHSYALRKYTYNAYLSFIEWEDTLRSHPGYATAAIAASKIYIRLHDNPKLAKPDISAAAKKAAKKAKKAEHKQAEENGKKPAAASKDDDEGPTPVDDDPEGLKLLATATPLDVAAKILQPLATLRADMLEGWIVTYDVAVRRGKYLQALRALNSAKAIDATSPELHVRLADFKSRINALPSPLPSDVGAVVSSGLESLLPGDPSLEAFNNAFLQQSPATASRSLAAAQVAKINKQPVSDVENLVFQMLHDEAEPSIPLCIEALSFLRTGFGEKPSERADEFQKACADRFVLSTVFKSEPELLAIRQAHTFGIGEDRADDSAKLEESPVVQ